MIDKTIGHYRINSLLGKGGMGEVYLAEDTTLNRKVTLKLLPEMFTSDPDRVARGTAQVGDSFFWLPFCQRSLRSTG